MILILLLLSALISISIILSSKKSRPYKKFYLVFIPLITILLCGAVFAKLSFYNDALDYTFLALILLLQPLLLIANLDLKSLTLKIISCIGLFVFTCAVGSLFAAHYTLTGRADQRVYTEDNQYIKVTLLGGATADCNYEVRRAVNSFYMFEKETAYQKTLTTPDLPECSSSH